jgi:hypothetical protein
MMLGRYDYPGRFEVDGISFCIEKEGALYRYRRGCGDHEKERLLSLAETELYVHPVEPVNLPREVTRFFEITFPSITISPDSNVTIYLTFPLEIGVILKRNTEYQLLDVFSKALPKYSLYGIPESGVITRYWESPVSDTLRVSDTGETGILQLHIRNSSKRWIDVARAVFDVAYMPIYFGPFISAAAEMILFSRDIAETRMLNTPLADGMQAAIQVITQTRLRMISAERGGFFMEHGVE